MFRWHCRRSRPDRVPPDATDLSFAQAYPAPPNPVPPHLPRLKGKTRPSASAPATSTHTADSEEKCRQQATSTASAAKRKASAPPPGTLNSARSSGVGKGLAFEHAGGTPAGGSLSRAAGAGWQNVSPHLLQQACRSTTSMPACKSCTRPGCPTGARTLRLHKYQRLVLPSPQRYAQGGAGRRHGLGASATCLWLPASPLGQPFSGRALQTLGSTGRRQ